MFSPGEMLLYCRRAHFTWFAGHVWSFALCRGCKSHLGWFFEKGETTFYGLVLANLVE
jgi:hypothetical protein